ncbi:hypothetical protein BJV74DRAFT_184829 [Russula compacta]|nr:hypothetical protein BJV74DRAFT_184829 [Russula compacta]
MLSPLGRKQRKGWKLPNSAPLTWNALGFERTAERPQYGKRQSFRLGGATSCFLFEGTFLLEVSKVEVSKHAGNMTRGRTGGALPNMSAFSNPLETGGVAWNRVGGIDRSISGTRAPNFIFARGFEHSNFASWGLWNLRRQSKPILKHMEDQGS